ncbi:MAG: FliM/FliN family flagellar motor switch protein [Planctomycetota bacterium]|jgi:flagellar motor switch protein FliM|nr:FliM/FliN family flagellar motor switch protein [Planctomycetota bacterium]
MADDLLSEDELSALLDAIGEDGGGGPRERIIIDYDFARPDKLNSDQIRSLQRIHEGIAQESTNDLSRTLRMNLEVSLVSIGQLSFDVFRNSLTNPTVIRILDVPNKQHDAVLTVDSKLSLSLIDRMLGGPGTALDDIRPLTGVEEELLDNLTDPFIGHLAEGWQRMSDFSFTVREREYDPSFLQVIPAGEMVLVATFSVQAPGEIESGEICVCIPFLDLEDAITKLAAQGRFADIRRDQTVLERGHLDRVVQDTSVEMRVDLGTATLTIGEILSLAVGDVVVLDQDADDQVTGHICGRQKLLGRAGRIGRKTGLIIDDVLPDP